MRPGRLHARGEAVGPGKGGHSARRLSRRRRSGWRHASAGIDLSARERGPEEPGPHHEQGHLREPVEERAVPCEQLVGRGDTEQKPGGEGVAGDACIIA